MRTEDEIRERIQELEIEIAKIKSNKCNDEWWHVPVREDIISYLKWVIGEES